VPTSQPDCMAYWSSDGEELLRRRMCEGKGVDGVIKLEAVGLSGILVTGPIWRLKVD